MKWSPLLRKKDSSTRIGAGGGNIWARLKGTSGDDVAHHMDVVPPIHVTGTGPVLRRFEKETLGKWGTRPTVDIPLQTFIALIRLRVP